METCVFCSDAEIDAREIARTGLVRAFPTNIPIVPGHTLVCPLRHVSTFSELSIDEREAIFALAESIKIALTKLYGVTGFHEAWNEGAVAGQSVPHFHLHIVPRKDGDEGITEYEPRKFLYRPGSRQETVGEELRAVAQEITNTMQL
ncbi:MAG: Histidine triad (HIT) domain protein [Parcubacteria group bacterium Athens0416_74]|nr:MAG: Histidine triad (HIT) domain protein [Parcubacteria group bacterium Athens0416_74]